MLKEQLRKDFKAKRNEIHSKDKLRMDDLLLLNFQKFDLNSIECLLTYWPMAEQNEPNTLLFSSYLRHCIPNLSIAYPKTNFENNEMNAILINEETVYKTNKYGITEPKYGDFINAIDIDVVFMPLLIFDNKGYRVGYGKGFYDKYLINCDENTLKIGFSYFEPIDKIDDTNTFDVPLTHCITPYNIYEF